MSIDDDQTRALAKLDGFLQGYYKQPGETIRRRLYCFAGSHSGALVWLRQFAAAGATDLPLKLVAGHEKQKELVGAEAGGA